MYVAKYTKPRHVTYPSRCASLWSELTEVYHKLYDLETGDPLLPPNPNTSCTLEVVPVHDNMNQQVEGNWHPRDGCQAD